MKKLKKKHDDVVMVRGFDLFLCNASWLQLQETAEDWGGNSSFEFTEQRATYMFEESRFTDASNAQQHIKSALHAVVLSS